MNPYDIMLELSNFPRSQSVSIITAALTEYANMLVDIYNDIYTSCIKVYYEFVPTVYKRHGDIKGFNLYSGFYSQLLDLKIEASYAPENLLGYRNITTSEVLDNVVSGQRGSKARKLSSGSWPQKWTAIYPNAYSEYNIWTSKATTIEDILSDYDANIVNDTQSIFWQIMSEHM